MERKQIKSGSITGIFAAALVIIVNTIMLFILLAGTTMSNELEAEGISKALLAINIAIEAVTVVFAVLMLVFNAIALKSANKEHAEFAKLRKYVITAVVFNFILVAMMICKIFTGEFNALTIVIIIGLIVAAIMQIKDMLNEDKNSGLAPGEFADRTQVTQTPKPIQPQYAESVSHPTPINTTTIARPVVNPQPTPTIIPPAQQRPTILPPQPAQTPIQPQTQELNLAEREKVIENVQLRMRKIEDALLKNEISKADYERLRKILLDKLNSIN